MISVPIAIPISAIATAAAATAAGFEVDGITRDRTLGAVLADIAATAAGCIAIPFIIIIIGMPQ